MDLPQRALLYGAFMEHQARALQQLPGFAPLPLPKSLAIQISSKEVPAAPATWSPHRPLELEGPLKPQFHVEKRKAQNFVSGNAAPSAWNQAIEEQLSRSEEGALRGMPEDSEQGASVGPASSSAGANDVRSTTTSPSSSLLTSTALAGEDQSSNHRVRPLVLSWLFKTDSLRRVRFTYFDGGTGVQAFNSLCYPHEGLDLPLLGVDLLSFGANKLLCVIDMQPITRTHHCTDKVQRALDNMRARHGDALFQGMSSRFFQETRFFSPHMLLLRSTQGWHDPLVQAPHGALFSSLSEFLSLYHELLASAPVLASQRARLAVRRGQQQYDEYFARTDPAIPLFTTYFGQEWSDRYAEEFLFPLCDFKGEKTLVQ